MYLEQFGIRFTSFLIIFLPIFLISGPFLPDLAATIVGIFFLIYAFKYKKFKYFNNYFFYYLCLIYFYINFSSLFSFDPKVSFSTSLAFLRIILFVISLSFFFTEYKNLKFKIFYVYIFGLILLFIDSIFQLFYGYNLLGFKQLDISRISSFFGDKHVMGSFVARLLPFFLAISFFVINKKIQLVVSPLILILSGLLVILSGERIAFVYYFISVIFYFFFLKNLKILLFYFLFFINIVGLIHIYNPNYINRIFKHTYTQLNEVKNFYNISYRHNLHYLTAYNIFLDHKLLGAGLKSFRYLCDDHKYSSSVKEKILKDNSVKSDSDGKFFITNNDQFINFFVSNDNSITNFNKVLEKDKENIFLFFFVKDGELVKKDQPIYSIYEHKNGCNTHPHNIYLQFLSELGLLGFFIFVFMFLYIIYNLFKLTIENLKNNLSNVKKSKALILVGALSAMLPLLPSGNYFGNWLLIITYLPFGLYISLSNKK
jgi:O-antigen ligase